MYKRTAKSKARKLLKDHNYMPSLNTISEGGSGGMFSKKRLKAKPKVSNKERKRLKENQHADTLFGMKFR